ncbi:MAG: flagellar hook-basal body complex protein [Cellvibrionaceae bacterium]
MPFNVALSGLRAANTDLKVTGNNIANASTTGFKQSRAEFADVYANSVLGSGRNPVGGGVYVQDVSQLFDQGNIKFTGNSLDMAVNGVGFFIVNDGGDQNYTRAGTFGLDDQGFIITNTNARLQGFEADDNGNVGGVLTDLQVDTNNQPPRQTTEVSSTLNLDATEEILERTGQQFMTTGSVIGVPTSGLKASQTTTNEFTSMLGQPVPASNYFTVSIVGSALGNDGSIDVRLDDTTWDLNNDGNITTSIELRELASQINAQLFAADGTVGSNIAGDSVDVIAVVNGNNLEFKSLVAGDNSAITVTDFVGDNTFTVGTAGTLFGVGQTGYPGTTVTTQGLPEVDNGYPAVTVDVVDPDGVTVTFNSLPGDSAAAIASSMNSLGGVSASASTTAIIRSTNYFSTLQPNRELVVTINGINFRPSNLQDLEDSINALSTTTLPGITAQVNTAGDLVVTSSIGDDLKFEISEDPSSTLLTDIVVEVADVNAGNSILLEHDNTGGFAAGNIDGDSEAVVVGGVIDVVLDEGYSVDTAAMNSDIDTLRVFGAVTAATFTDVQINEFDPNDPATYNHVTSLNVYDSLGNSHVLSQYFVKQAHDPSDPLSRPNHWVMNVLVDGGNVGDPDTTLPPPDNTLSTLANYNLYFDEDGQLDSNLSDNVLISNWDPVDADGNPTGALGPLNQLAGGALPVVEPPASSNFEIEMDGTTQYGAAFSVLDVDQNGFTTGRISGLDVDPEGVIFARFTNGETSVLGQLALADFPNMQGLQPIGDTMWAENFESGIPNIATASTGALGAITAGALEESNVDLSEQLVNLIIAQRNFQASAKTIETADSVTQTIINIR